MDRRSFLKTGAVTTVAAGIGCGPDLLAASRKKSGRRSSPFKVDMPDVPGGLRVRFLGTGAADWKMPDERGENRRWTSILLDGRVLVDFTFRSEDMLPAGCRPEVIFYTHSHPDHYHPGAALKAGVSRVYLGESWIKRGRDNFTEGASQLGMDVPEILPLAEGQTVDECGLRITALPANHGTGDINELTLMYLIEKGPVRLLYATDTGGIPYQAARRAGIDKHQKHGQGITGLIMEATMGMDFDEDWHIFNHSSVGTVLRTVHVLQESGRYHPAEGQPVFLTHLSRKMHGTQAELDATLPSPLVAAYDGLEVCFKGSGL